MVGTGPSRDAGEYEAKFSTRDPRAFRLRGPAPRKPQITSRVFVGAEAESKSGAVMLSWAHVGHMWGPHGSWGGGR
jgi:hypothetical protein